MNDQATQYYKGYLDNNGYKMGNTTTTSRIAYLKQFVQDNTPKGGKVLDVGCGDMTLSKLMPEFNWTGLDINTTQSEGKAVEHNIDNPPYPFDPSTFDTVVCSEVLEHMFNPLGINKEIRRIIKPTGTYILSTPNFNWVDNWFNHHENLMADLTKPWTYEHIRQYSFGSHEQLLDQAGFKVQSFIGADAQFSQFLAQGREPLQKFIQALGVKDPNLTITDQLIGAMFPLHNHTIMLVTKPV